MQKLGEVCKKFSITGLVLVGATHALSDAAFLNEYLIANKIETNVVFPLLWMEILDIIIARQV